jgi:hypothetical protein
MIERYLRLKEQNPTSAITCGCQMRGNETRALVELALHIIGTQLVVVVRYLDYSMLTKGLSSRQVGFETTCAKPDVTKCKTLSTTTSANGKRRSMLLYQKRIVESSARTSVAACPTQREGKHLCTARENNPEVVVKSSQKPRPFHMRYSSSQAGLQRNTPGYEQGELRGVE